MVKYWRIKRTKINKKTKKRKENIVKNFLFLMLAVALLPLVSCEFTEVYPDGSSRQVRVGVPVVASVNAGIVPIRR